MAMPSLTLLGLDLFPERKGLAASCQAFVLTGGNSIVAGAMAPWAQASASRLAWVSAGCTTAGLAGWLVFRRRCVSAPGGDDGRGKPVEQAGEGEKTEGTV